MAKIIKKAQNGVIKTPKLGKQTFGLPKGAKAVPQKDRRYQFIKELDSIFQERKKSFKEAQEYANKKPLKEQLKHLGNELFVEPFKKNGGSVKKKMKNGGSLSGLKASNKRVGPVDPKGAFTKVQKKTLAGAKGKASLTKDKQLGATKMAKKGMKISKKK
jgi:hypothetical protein